jgi:hypothetical protein
MGKAFWIGFVVILIVAGVCMYIYFFTSPKNTSCPIGGIPGEEDSIILKMINPGELAGGLGIGAESYTFRDDNEISLCCYDVEDSSDKRFKICDYTNPTNTSIYYEVLYEYKNGAFVKTRETLPEYGTRCFYYYDNSGQISSRYCGLN